jgi:hypothetical protein
MRRQIHQVQAVVFVKPKIADEEIRRLSSEFFPRLDKAAAAPHIMNPPERCGEP